MKFCRRAKKQSGYTLLEVMLSVAILGILFMTTMGFFSQSFQYTKENESKTVGVNVARNVLNYLERQDFEEMHKKLDHAKQLELSYDTCKNETEILTGNCEAMFNTTVNNVPYHTKAKLSLHSDEKLRDYLIPIAVEVEWQDESIIVEGAMKR